MKKKSASKKRNQEMKEEIDGLHKEIARMKKAEYKKIRSIRETIERSYCRWLHHVEKSETYKQTQREHPLLRWGQPLNLNVITGLPFPPRNYPGGREGWYADSLYFATRNGKDFCQYRFYKECKEMGLLIGSRDADWMMNEPTLNEVARMNANEKQVERYQFGDEERRKNIIRLLKSNHSKRLLQRKFSKKS